MPYPDRLINVLPGLTLYLPDPGQVKCMYEKLLAADPLTPFPFWAKTWPSAFELAIFLREEPTWVKGKNILELGAGTALPSFSATHLASNITVSDYAPDAVALMEKNIGHLRLSNVKAMQLDWNNFPTDIKAEVLLLSDINYASDQFIPLLGLIQTFLNNGSTIILSTPQRINITPFAEALQPFTRHSVLRIHQQINDVTEVRILVLSAENI